MNLNNNKENWFIYCNNVNGVCGFHCKDFHKEWKDKQRNNNSVLFFSYSINATIC